MFVLPKQNEVTTVYEYLQAPHQRFFREPELTELHEEITNLRQELESELNPSPRKILLRLIDVQGYLKNDVSLECFAAGSKLASGIAKELEADGLYSYDTEMEEQMEGKSKI